MPAALPRLRSVAFITAAVITAALLTACNETGIDAVVTKVVDGDTIDVEYDGQERRVRLLNIDTPETVDPDVEPECLGPEATAFLTSMLPVGTEVHLEPDEEVTDQYDRYLAGVFLGETLVNAEIARAGLGAAVLYEPNDRFYDEVLAAQEEARAAGRGLYDETAGCTLPAQMAAASTSAASVAEAAPASGATLEELHSYGDEIAAAAATAAAVAALLEGDRSALPLIAFTDADLVRMRDSVQTTSDQLQALRGDTDAAVTAEEERLAEAEAQRRAAAEAEQRAAEEAERRAAEEAERQAAAAEEERRAAERERQQQASQERSSGSSSSGRSSGSSSGSADSSGSSGSTGSSGSSGSPGGYDGYTGCRAYGGGYTPNAVDEKGRPYTKIDCDTRAPIG